MFLFLVLGVLVYSHSILIYVLVHVPRGSDLVLRVLVLFVVLSYLWFCPILGPIYSSVDIFKFLLKKKGWLVLI